MAGNSLTIGQLSGGENHLCAPPPPGGGSQSDNSQVASVTCR
jgi:hypothetical protein